MNNNNETASFLHWLNMASWIEYPEELLETPVRKKRPARLSLEEAGCEISHPDDISRYLHEMQVEDELEPLMMVIRCGSGRYREDRKGTQ